MKYLEIKFWQFAKYLIIKGYGCDCETKDLDDIPHINEATRCPSCCAKEIVEWIDQHIDLLKM